MRNRKLKDVMFRVVQPKSYPHSVGFCIFLAKDTRLKATFLESNTMRKTYRTLAEAQETAKRKIARYILALNIAYASKVCSEAGLKTLDADYIESTIRDFDDSVLYYEQQDTLKKSFCISSNVLRRFTSARHSDGKTRVPIKPIMDEISKDLRLKSYNDRGTPSWKAGHYPKMYIYNYDSIINICKEWIDSDSYNEKFDLGSSYYSEVSREIKARLKLDFMDFNKPQFRKQVDPKIFHTVSNIV